MTANVHDDEIHHIKPIIVSHHYHNNQLQDTTSSLASSSLENNVTGLPKSASSSFKRVSFGNSKGTVVETFIYESVPTVEEGYYYGTASPSGSSYNQTLSVREQFDTPPNKVKVKTLESQTPSYICPPSTNVNVGGTKLLNNGGFAGSHQTSGVLIVEKRYVANQTSPSSNLQKMETEDTENPFRPDGQLSHEVEPIVECYKKRPFPISAASSDFADGTVLLNSSTTSSSKTPPSSPPGKKAANSSSSPIKQSSKNGGRETVTKPQDIKLTLTNAEGHNSQLEIQHKQLTSPKAGHVEVVHIGEKKRRCGCCSIQ